MGRPEWDIVIDPFGLLLFGYSFPLLSQALKPVRWEEAAIPSYTKGETGLLNMDDAD